MAKGLANIEIKEASMKNLNRQINKLKKLAPEKAKGGMIKILFDIKGLAQMKLKYNNHIVTSRLRNSIYVQTPIPTITTDNAETYRDKYGKVFNSKLDVHLESNEAAVGTNVEYAPKIEYGYNSFLYWALKNVDLNKRWREVSKELLGMNR